MGKALWVARISAIMASGLGILSVVALLLAPTTMPAAQVLSMFDPDWPAALQDWTMAWLGQWVWLSVAIPLLMRPIWLAPVCLMLIFAGIAITVQPPAPSRTSDDRDLD